MATNFCRYLSILCGFKGFVSGTQCLLSELQITSQCNYLTRLNHIRFYWHHYRALQHSKILKEEPLVHWDDQSLFGKVWLHMTATYRLQSQFCHESLEPID